MPVASRTRSRTSSMTFRSTTGRVRRTRSGRERFWIWVSECRVNDPTSCPVCWAMHGTIHPWAEPLASHPNCGCSQARKWGRPYVLGEDRFARLSEDAQLRILGPARYRAYRLGEIKLADCVVETRHPKYGKGRRLATLAELGIG